VLSPGKNGLPMTGPVAPVIYRRLAQHNSERAKRPLAPGMLILLQTADILPHQERAAWKENGLKWSPVLSWKAKRSRTIAIDCLNGV